MKRLTLLAIMSLFIFALVGCGESEISKVDADDEKGKAKAEQKDKKKKEDIHELKVGDSVTIDGAKVTVNSAVQWKGDGEWNKPTNDKFVILDITVENVSDESYNLSSLLMMNLQDPEGYEADLSIMTETKGSLDGEILPDRQMRGEIAFDVSDHDTYEFIYEEPLKSGQAIWVLTDLPEKE